MNRQYAYFNELPVKTVFNLNGNTWIKRSTRTAEIVDPGCYAGMWFYFGKRDLCVVNTYSRLGV